MEARSTIHGMIECYAAESPGDIAVLDKDQAYTYDDLNKKANQLAHILCAYQLPNETIIAISIDRSMELLVGLLAILKSGYAYLPLDANQPIERLQFQLTDANAPVIITHSDFKHTFSNFAGKLILIDEIWNELESQNSDNPLQDIQPDNLAYVIFTSGSTGVPKGVLIQHQSVVNYINWFKSYTGCSRQDRMDFSSNIIFDMAVTPTLAALACGLQISICSDEIKKNVSEYLRYLARENINLIKITPGYFKVLREAAANINVSLPKLQSIILGGEQLQTRDCLAWLKFYPHHHLYNEYGPTEATVAVAVFKITDQNVKTLETAVPIGKPGLNMICELNESTGELLIGGVCLARGYLNQKKLTSERFENNRYKTGDICRYLPDENIEFITRIDNQVKIRGYRIELGEVETNLASHPGVKDATVISRVNSEGDKQLIAYYISTEGIKSAELRQYLQQRLADYMVPSFFIRLSAMPLTANGKLDIQSLPEPEKNNEIVVAQNQIERALVNIWKKIFSRQDIGVTCNFFDLGGHSLLAARMINTIEQELHVKLPLQQLYGTANIKELALVITKLAGSQSRQWENENISEQHRIVYDDKNIPLADFQFLLWLIRIVEPTVTKLSIVVRKRFSGEIDAQALTSALNWVIKKNEVFSYKPKMFTPAQYLESKNDLSVKENDLSKHSVEDIKKILAESVRKLMYRKTWFSRKNPWIIANVFKLKNNMTEIQLSIPHVIFDDASSNIILSQLDQAYSHFKNGNPLPSLTGANFKEFINEQTVKTNELLTEKIDFWKEYLQDVSPLSLPQSKIIKNMKNKTYSTWIKMPMETMRDMQQICADLSLSVMDIVCAAITLGLKESTGESQGKVFANIVRTARDNEQYINTIGCFLRLDPVKLDLETNLDLIELAKQIQNARVMTEQWQSCPILAKMANLNKHWHEPNLLKKMVNVMTTAYCHLFSKLQLNAKVIGMAINANLASMRSKNQFLISINLFNNFITPKNADKLFGNKLERIETHQHDLVSINNMLELSFLYNESMDQVYLVVSANLVEEYRTRIGEGIVNSLALVTA